MNRHHRIPVLPSFEWAEAAACRQLPITPEAKSDLFFAANPSAAIAVCNRCPTREACLAWAVAANEQDGTWGGLGQDERRRYRNRLVRSRRLNSGLA